MGAGAAHASSKVEKQDQINRDVPRICYKILDKEYGCAMGEFMDQNVQEKMVSLSPEDIADLILVKEREREREREGENVCRIRFHFMRWVRSGCRICNVFPTL